MGMRAFPGAQGRGAVTRGAFGGPVPPVILFVANLNDTGLGSERAAWEDPRPRLIIYLVSGTIILRTPLKLENPFVTICYQTSTGGVQHAGEEARIQTHDFIVRFGRFRSGDKIIPRDGWDNRDALNFGKSGQPAHHGILDHCEFAYGVDETLTAWFLSHDITVQDSWVYEPLFHSLHPKGAHAMGILAGNFSGDIDYIRVLNFASNQRGPQFDSTTGLMRWINSWSVGYGLKGMELEGTVGDVDVINSGFKRGPDTSVTPSPTGISVSKDSLTTLRLRIQGTVDPSLPDPNMDNWSIVRDPGGHTVPEGSNRVFTRDDPGGEPVPIVSAAEAFAKIIESGGSSKPFRDPTSYRIAWKARNACIKRGSSWLVNSTDELPQYQDFPIAAWPILTGPPPPTDSNGDGIPDQWAIDHGFAPDADIALVLSDDGEFYWIERYVNDPALAGDPA
jgi:hypothetical protein